MPQSQLLWSPGGPGEVLKLETLTGVEEQQELEAGDLPAVHLQQPQLGRQLLTPLDQSGERGLGL